MRTSISKTYFYRTCWFIFICLVTSSQIAIAQTIPSSDASQKLVPIIALLLLEDQEREPTGTLELSVGQTITTQLGFQFGGSNNPDKLEFALESSNDDLHLCFQTIDIQTNEISVSINGNSLGSVPGDEGEVCFDIPAAQLPNASNIFRLTHNNPGERWGITDVSLELNQVMVLGLPRVNRVQWGDDAVRKVLKIFAFGGHATDQQIRLWADSNPEQAIAEMLNFEKHNLKLSPVSANERYAQFANNFGTFWDFSDHLSADESNLPLPQQSVTGLTTRFRLGVSFPKRGRTFARLATTRGFNPFRQRIGHWETNYHLAVSNDPSDGNVNPRQITRYYDDIMNAHESGVPYQQVLAIAAKSAAITEQYGHTNARWDATRGVCLTCNDDFAREIHQLFFGIFGFEDPEGGLSHHEEVTIPQSSLMLTGITIPRINGITGWVTEASTENHHQRSLNILNQTITGSTAAEKIDNLVEFSIVHPESEDNLPIIIISGLADDKLSDASIELLRNSWKSMGANKQFLDFIRAYAISTLFHSAEQAKYLTSVERLIYLANKVNLSNTESLIDRFDLDGRILNEDIIIFRPAHVVFGGQTSIQASDSGLVFERHVNSSSDEIFNYTNGASCTANHPHDCDGGQSWLKDWSAVVPKVNGLHTVEATARWLWQRIVGNTDNYTQLERAHLLTLLGSPLENGIPVRNDVWTLDLSHMLCIRQRILENSDNPDVSLKRLRTEEAYLNFCQGRNREFTGEDLVLANRTYTLNDISNTDYIQALLDELGAEELPLNSSDAQQRLLANERVQHAIAFIAATPYVFVDGERQ